MKCNPTARAQCPHGAYCEAFAVYTDESECAKFNQSVLAKPKTNADRIRAMSDEELAKFLCSLAFARETPWSDPFVEKFCKNCPTVKAIIEGFDKEMELSECDFVDGECPHGDDVVWWLQQPAEGADNG